MLYLWGVVLLFGCSSKGSLDLSGLRLFLFVSFLSFSLPSLAAAEQVPGEFIIRYGNNTTQNDQSYMNRSLGIKTKKKIKLINASLVSVKDKKSLNTQYAKDLLASGAIDYIEPNYKYQAYATPSDSDYLEQWALNNIGQAGGTHNIDIDAPEAWDINTGSEEIIVGIVDTGVNYNHPDLADNIWVNPNEIPNNGIDDDQNGVIDDVHGFNALTNSGDPNDDNGHGTHCAGIIGAKGNNSLGISGANWKVKLMGLKFLSASGGGTTDTAIAAIEYAVTMKNRGVNIKVLNNSWGGSSYSAALEDAVQAANQAGILFVAAAGNASNDNDTSGSYPANITLDNVVSVAAIDNNGNLASFSNYGRQSVHLAAPGKDIYSTLLEDSYASLSGTSMAAPYVAGVAALVLSNNPELSTAHLRQRLMNTVKPLEGLAGQLIAPGTVSAYNALSNIQHPLPPAPASIEYRTIGTNSNYNPHLGSRISNNDDEYKVVNLEFGFPYFGEIYNRLAISTNGRIIPLQDNESRPRDSDFSNNLSFGILPYHDDLYPATAIVGEESGVWLSQNSTSARLTWIMMNYGNRSSTDPESVIRFQATITDSGQIEFSYEDTVVDEEGFTHGRSATVGIAPVTGGHGKRLLVSHNEDASSMIGNNKGMRFVTKSKPKMDFDGDSVSDIVVWRPSFGMWFILTSSTNFDFSEHQVYQFGLPTDKPVSADFDGDGKTDLAVYRPENGYWFYSPSSSGFTDVKFYQWGLPGDSPMPADYDGDGKDDLTVYRPSTGMFYVLNSSTSFSRSQHNSTKMIPLGGNSHYPVRGDFNGDGKYDFVTVWSLIRFWTAKDDFNNMLFSLPWGEPGDTPITCDYDQDGITDRVAVRTTSNGTLNWFILTSENKVFTHNFGSWGDVPSCDKDFDGDGAPDISVYRPSSGQWFIKKSSQEKISVVNFGLPGDISF